MHVKQFLDHLDLFSIHDEKKIVIGNFALIVGFVMMEENMNRQHCSVGLVNNIL